MQQDTIMDVKGMDFLKACVIHCSIVMSH